jgi:hypothetical protein
MDALAPMLLLVIVLAIVGLAAVSEGRDSRDDFDDGLLWPTFGHRIR